MGEWGESEAILMNYRFNFTCQVTLTDMMTNYFYHGQPDYIFLSEFDSRHEQIKLILVTIDIRSSFFAYGLYFDIYNVSILFPKIWRAVRVVAAEVILIFKSLSECTRMFCDFWWMGGC